MMVYESSEESSDVMFVDLFWSVLEFSGDIFFLFTLTDFSFLSTEALDF